MKDTNINFKKEEGNPSNNNVVVNENNFIYEKLSQFLKSSTFNSLEKYTASQLKAFDSENKIPTEKMKKINHIFNQIRILYIDEITTVINKIEEKYSLKAHFKNKSDAMLVEIILKELNISLDDLIKYESFSQSEKQEETIMQYYLTNFLREKTAAIEQNTIEINKELAELKEKNRLMLDI